MKSVNSVLLKTTYLSLRKGISVLIGRAFERLFSPSGVNLNKPIFKSSNAWGVAREWGGGGRHVEASI